MKYFWVVICVLILGSGITAQEETTLLLANFEAGVPLLSDAYNTPLGFVPWGDKFENVQLAAQQVVGYGKLALPGREAAPNGVLAVHYDIGGWGGFTHVFTDGSDWISMDWTTYNALSFWLYGNNTGGIVQVDLFDNRNPDIRGDTAERFFYRLTDDYNGWRHFIIPFALFQRRTDWQPSGALNDGLGLNEVSGYAFGFPSGVGAQVAYIDEVMLMTVENTASVIISGLEEDTTVVVDESITWDSRSWELVWSDEFEGEAGTPINAEYWTCEVGGAGWGNREMQYYTQSTENAALDGSGALVITAREENPENYSCWYGACTYTSARCITKGKVEFTYGRVEARIKIPRGQGIWPAFWMLGANFDQVGWPNSGEIDILENVGFEPKTVHGTVHGPGYSGGSGIGGAYHSTEDFADDYHIYAIDWDADAIRWYVDGVLYNIFTPAELGNRKWVFDHDFFLLLNVAVGGQWPGYPDETTILPQSMFVDYVRVYKLAQ